MTSACFIIPAVVAWKKARMRRDAMAISGLALTSIGFHSTYHPLIYHIDRLYAHAFATYYSYLALCKAVFTRHVMPLVYSVGVLLCWKRECHITSMTPMLVHVPLHMGIHLCAIGALMSHFMFAQGATSNKIVKHVQN